MGRREDLARELNAVAEREKRALDEAAAERARVEKELIKLDSLPDLRALEEGTVFVAVVRLGGTKPYTYVGMKTHGKFYLTGKTSPDGVAADAMEAWFTRPGRTLLAFQVLATIEVQTIPIGFGAEMAFDLAAALAEGMRDTRLVLGGAFDETNGRWQ